MKSINPFIGEVINEYPEHSQVEADRIIDAVHQEWLKWKDTTFEYRAGLFRNVAGLLRKNKET